MWIVSLLFLCFSNRQDVLLDSQRHHQRTSAADGELMTADEWDLPLVTQSMVHLVLQPEDHGHNIVCSANNKLLQHGTLQGSFKLNVTCKWPLQYKMLLLFVTFKDFTAILWIFYKQNIFTLISFVSCWTVCWLKITNLSHFVSFYIENCF